MGKHSQPRRPILPRVLTKGRAPLLGIALLPIAGVATAATGTGTDHLTFSSPEPATAESPAPSTTLSSTTAPSNPDTPKALSAVTPLPAAAPKTTDNPAEPTVAAPPPLPQSVLDGDVPRIAFEAYRHAADTIAHTQPTCGVPWTLIAGIGRVESHHANSGDTWPDGTLKNPIYGPTLDGSLGGNEVVMDTDGGRLDGDPVYDRAVGPMQFLPSTWERYAADGNGDGKADPQNIFDAALTTARYLCDGGLDLRNAAAQATAILRYNNSFQYLSDVLGFEHSY